MKIAFSLSLLFLLAATCLPQARTCELGYDEAPTVRGLKLGMSLQKIEQSYPGVRVRTKEGKDSILITPFTLTKSAFGTNLYGITIDLTDESTIDNVWFFYSDNVKWKNATEFSDQISESLGLDPRLWKSMSSSIAKMECAGFDIYITSDGPNPSLSVRKSKRLMEAEEEKKKKAFKP